ncbi:MAG: hypothetical protein BIFFINMI_04207 [Phycisphaerae bacterium]|nr:hypothetical protein [Phycisphaerae bacterium]
MPARLQSGGIGLPLGFDARGHYRNPIRPNVFFTGFCLIANDAYLGAGAFEGVSDAGDLLRHGASAWQLWAFGAATVPLGLWLWHNQAPHFGLGSRARPVPPGAAWITLALLAVVLALEFVFG